MIRLLIFILMMMPLASGADEITPVKPTKKETATAKKNDAKKADTKKDKTASTKKTDTKKQDTKKQDTKKEKVTSAKTNDSKKQDTKKAETKNTNKKKNSTSLNDTKKESKKDNKNSSTKDSKKQSASKSDNKKQGTKNQGNKKQEKKYTKKKNGKKQEYKKQDTKKAETKPQAAAQKEVVSTPAPVPQPKDTKIFVSSWQQDSIRRSIDNQTYGQRPWVTLMSRPNKITNGLEGRHVTIWPSHGRYYKQDQAIWKWQRPELFCTTEDLFTQSIVNPYLLPMLQNAGCVVYVPRERDWQTEECIVDNDNTAQGYSEESGRWKSAPRAGFAYHAGKYYDGENPFTAGSARMTKANKKGDAKIIYTPEIKVEGEHAVYISYQTVEKSADDAEYTVVHRGIETVYHVNQRMGGSTWVYLGSFDFGAYDPANNYVKLTNKSHSDKYMITADAVKIGGGMGNIERGGTLSGLPRAMEGARYWTMWAGGPREVTMCKNGRDDYGEDINARSLMSNWLSYGSAYNPVKLRKQTDTADSTLAQTPDSVKKVQSKYDTTFNVTEPDKFTGHVPIELSLAVHSDAGWRKDKKSFVGSLTICTTDFNKGVLQTGMPRSKCYEFAQDILNNAIRDINYKFGRWARHSFFDRNYSETRLPAQPSAIFETLSHQNFPDMKFGHDPEFKFTLARSIYKTILRTLAAEHGINAVVQPLPAKALETKIDKDGNLRLTWTPVYDGEESTASPTSYNIYMAKDKGGMNNGTNVRYPEYTMKLEPNVLYRFRVTQVNSGGESFPTEELCALYNPDADATALIINGFHRLSGPATIDTDSIQGFDIEDDLGLSYGRTTEWCGKQTTFDTSKGGTTLGNSSNELMGRFFAGNDFNYTTEHARALATANRCNIISMSSECIDGTGRSINGIDMVDLLLGAEKNDGHSLKPYKSFSLNMQQALKAYAANGGKIMVSGAYMASDMMKDDEIGFIYNTFHLQLDTIDVIDHPLGYSFNSINGDKENVSGMGMSIPTYRTINAVHYATPKADAFNTDVKNAFATLDYASGRHAAIAFNGTNARTFAMGFPFECIRSADDQAALMRGIVHFLLGERKPKVVIPTPVETTNDKKKKKNKK